MTVLVHIHVFYPMKLFDQVDLRIVCCSYVWDIVILLILPVFFYLINYELVYESE